ncbi:MAG: transketolase [Candidatus Sericytochromatia bacterium]|nr:transketolase [Candidatus Sericytochromatia bacterium]
MSVDELIKEAVTVRRDIIEMIAHANSGHPGGSLSATEIVTALYFNILNHDPKNPHWEDRDRFILSKGHACPVLYSCMARTGYFPVEELKTFRAINSRIQGHPEVRKLPGIEASTGSLGQGLSIGIGLALGAKLQGKNYRTYVLTGDGELDEGQVWESALCAGHKALDNLVAIVDSNKFQLDGAVKDIMPLASLPDKWNAFGWNVIEIEDGNNMQQVVDAFEKAETVKGKPTVIIANTIKGKGVSYMENNNEFHGAAPTPEQLAQALKELV